MITTNTTFESPTYMYLARCAAQRCANSSGSPEAITAIVMAYIAFEAFLNEVAQLASTLSRQDDLHRIYDAIHAGKTPADISSAQASEIAKGGLWLSRSIEPPVVPVLAQELQAAVSARKTTEDRYRMAIEILTGKSLNWGSEPQQSLRCLLSIRNHIVHTKSEETKIELEMDPEIAATTDGAYLGCVVEIYREPSFVRCLQSRKLIANNLPRQNVLFNICTKAVADWACDTVVRLAKEVEAAAPPGSALRSDLNRRSLLASSVALGTTKAREWSPKESSQQDD